MGKKQQQQQCLMMESAMKEIILGGSLLTRGGSQPQHCRPKGLRCTGLRQEASHKEERG